jgi:hypothetical protein
MPSGCENLKQIFRLRILVIDWLAVIVVHGRVEWCTLRETREKNSREQKEEKRGKWVKLVPLQEGVKAALWEAHKHVRFLLNRLQ